MKVRSPYLSYSISYTVMSYLYYTCILVLTKELNNPALSRLSTETKLRAARSPEKVMPTATTRPIVMGIQLVVMICIC